MLAVACLLLLAPPARQSPAESAPEPVDPPPITRTLSADRASADSYPYAPDFDGTAFFWLSSDKSDPQMLIEDESGNRLAGDDDSGGVKNAFVRLNVDRHSKYRVFTLTAKGAEPAAATLTIRIAPESAETRAAAKTLAAACVEAMKIFKSGDTEGGRTTVALALDKAFAVPGAAWSRDLTNAVFDAGNDAYRLGSPQEAQRAFRFALVFRERCLPPDHELLQYARINTATTLKESFGDLNEVLALEKKALASFQRTRPPDHLDITKAEQGMSVTLEGLGQMEAALDLSKKVFDTRARTLAPDSLELLISRNNYARLLDMRGELEEASRLLHQSLAIAEKYPPELDDELEIVRMHLSRVEELLGHFEVARDLAQLAVDAYARVLPPTHNNRLRAQWRLSSALLELGEQRAARDINERLLEACLADLPDDHPSLQNARIELGTTLYRMGDMTGARALFEKVLEVRELTLPDDNPLLQQARGNLASVLDSFGEFDTALGLCQKVYDVFSATLPPEHPDVLKSRQGLAVALKHVGRYDEARALEEAALAIATKSMPDDDRTVCALRTNLAHTLEQAGELSRARELLEKVLADKGRVLPPDHIDMVDATLNHVQVLAQLGERAALVDSARRLCSLLQRQANLLALTSSPREAETSASIVFSDAVSLLLSVAGGANVAGGGNIAGGANIAGGGNVAGGGNIADGANKVGALPELDAEVCAAAESLRGLPLVVGRVSRGVARANEDRVVRTNAGDVARTNVGEVARLRAELRDASNTVTRTALDPAHKDALAEAVRRRDRLERELREKAVGDLRVPPLEISKVAAALRADEAAVVYREYSRWEPPKSYPVLERRSERRFLAFVVRRDGALRRFELGPASAIDSLVDRWREAIRTPVERGMSAQPSEAPDAVATSGTELRVAVLDPMLPALDGVRRLVVVADGALHLVAFDALPLAEDLVGSRFEVSERSTLWELLIPTASPASESTFLGLGEIDYDSAPQKTQIVGSSDPAADERSRAASDPSASRPAAGSQAKSVPPTSTPTKANSASPASTASKANTSSPTSTGSPTASASSTGTPSAPRTSTWDRSFVPLPSTGSETEGIAKLFTKTFGESSSARVLKESAASKGALFELAPTARWLHVATHGYFSRDSVGAIEAPRNRSLPGSSQLERVQGLSPLVLCGIALAGANLPSDESGDFPGIATGEELAALDLSRCDLAVLSACNTHEGERNAGQGVASLQRALFTAGVQSTITSLWKVPDESARELMTDFYRRLWVQKKSKSVALWEAKMRLRNEKDATGRSVYSPRDWAGWILSGDAE